MGISMIGVFVVFKKKNKKKGKKNNLISLVGGGAPSGSSPVHLVLPCLIVIRFRISPPFFPLSSSLHPHHIQRLSFHSKTNSPRVADTNPSFNTLLYC